MLQETAHEWAVFNFASGCEVADMLVQRLDFEPGVREALAFTFERWNGKGFPTHASGEAIPLAMRVVHLSHDMEAIGRIFSPGARSTPPAIAATARTTRCSPTCSSQHGDEWFERLRTIEPWDAVLELEPEPRRVLDGDALDDALDRRRRLHRPQVAVHGRAQPPLRGPRRGCRPCARVPRRRHRRGSAGRRSYTTSAPPRSRTRSGTSPAR